MMKDALIDMVKALCRVRFSSAALAFPLAVASFVSAQTVDQLIPHKVKLESVEYLGKRAVKITEDGQVADGEAYAILKGSGFHNGAIEVELAGRPPPGPPRPRALF